MLHKAEKLQCKQFCVETQKRAREVCVSEHNVLTATAEYSKLSLTYLLPIIST